MNECMYSRVETRGCVPGKEDFLVQCGANRVVMSTTYDVAVEKVIGFMSV